MCRNTETQVSRREAKEPILPLVQCRSARRATSDTRTPQLRGHAPRLTPSTAAVVPAVVAFRVIVMLVCPLTDPAARASSRTADAMGAWPGGAERRVSARSGGSGLHTVCPARAQVGGPSLTQQRASSAASRALPHLHLGTSRSVLTRNAKAAAVNGAALPSWQCQRGSPLLQAFSGRNVARSPAGLVWLQRRRVCGRSHRGAVGWRRGAPPCGRA